MSEEMEVAVVPTPPSEPKSFQDRLSEIPAYTMTLSQLLQLYTTLKDRNEVLKSAFTTGEQYAEKITQAAKPVLVAAAESAFKVAKPVVGEVQDPVAKIDNCASEALAKVQEKLPFVNQTPTEIAQAAKTSAQETANYYLGKAQSSSIAQQTTKQLDNAVSFSELMVEICFPTDGSNAEDIKELEKAEEDEEKSLVVRAGNLKDRAIRRGRRKIMSYQPIVSTLDTVQYAQAQISDLTSKLVQGTNYVVEKSSDAKNLLVENYPVVKSKAEQTISEGTELISQKWDQIYQTTMYIPNKALQVSGEVYISTQEIVFAYTKAHSLTEIPHAVAEMAESYYKTLTTSEQFTVENAKETAVAFVYVPAQVVAEYIRDTRVVQWVIPKTIETDSIQLMENLSENVDTEEE